MTSKLKCPFCEYELQENITTNLCCPICGLVAPTKLWQALIQSQQDLEESQQATLENAQTILEIHKDLEIATKALKKIESTEWYDSMSSYEIMTFTAMKALETIGKHNE